MKLTSAGTEPSFSFHPSLPVRPALSSKPTSTCAWRQTTPGLAPAPRASSQETRYLLMFAMPGIRHRSKRTPAHRPSACLHTIPEGITEAKPVSWVLALSGFARTGVFRLLYCFLALLPPCSFDLLQPCHPSLGREVSSWNARRCPERFVTAGIRPMIRARRRCCASDDTCDGQRERGQVSGDGHHIWLGKLPLRESQAIDAAARRICMRCSTSAVRDAARLYRAASAAAIGRAPCKERCLNPHCHDGCGPSYPSMMTRSMAETGGSLSSMAF